MTQTHIYPPPYDSVIEGLRLGYHSRILQEATQAQAQAQLVGWIADLTGELPSTILDRALAEARCGLMSLDDILLAAHATARRESRLK